jgi:hypothetical protein
MSSQTRSSGSTTQNQTQTQTPTNPSWVTQPLQDLTSQITALGNVSPTSYVAPQSALQLQANQQGASTLGGTNPDFGTAAGLFNSNASVSPGSISQWMSPYTSSVVNTADSLANNEYGMQNAQLARQGAGAQAFGGSGYGIAQGVLGGQQALDYGNLNANLLNTGYTNAQNAAFQDAQLGQSAATGLANTGTEQSAANVANISALAGLGAAQQQTAQAQATAPISLAQAMATLYGQNQYSLFNGQTATANATGHTNQVSTNSTGALSSILGALAGSGGLLSGLGSAAQGIGSLASTFAPA